MLGLEGSGCLHSENMTRKEREAALLEHQP